MDYLFFGNKHNATIHDYVKNKDIILDSKPGNILYDTYLYNTKNCHTMKNNHFSFEKLLHIININTSTIKSVDKYMNQLMIGDTIHRTNALDCIIQIFVCNLFDYEENNIEIIESIIKCDMFIFNDYLKYIVNKNNKFQFNKFKEKDKYYMFSVVCILLQVVGDRNCLHC
jgi:hypothetical protein